MEFWDFSYKKNEQLTLNGRRLFRKDKEENYEWKTGERVLNQLNVKKSDKILDVGCGSFGKIVIPASRIGIKVTAVDISPTAIKLLKNASIGLV